MAALRSLSSQDSPYTPRRKRPRRLYLHRPSKWDVAFCSWIMVLYPPFAWLIHGSIPGFVWLYAPSWALLTLAACCVGVRRDGGSRRRFAFTRTKAHGTTTPATATSAGCSSSARRGSVQAVDTTPRSITPALEISRLPRARESNYIGPSWYGHATDIHGVSGEPLASAGSDRPWPSWSA